MDADLINQLVYPFWLSNDMLQESVLFVQEGGNPPDAPLLFPPTQIFEVQDAKLEMRYVEGKDWVCRGNRLFLPHGSRICHLDYSDLRTDSPPAGAGLFPGRDGRSGVLFAEGDFFHRRQTVVTYEHTGSKWEGPVPAYKGSLLPATLEKLRQGNLNMILFGDSISVGANASSLSGVSPYLPTWGELVKHQLEEQYQAKIRFSNPSEGGRETTWGLEQIKLRVANQSPDLVILAFGMNDGTIGLEPGSFLENISRMMEIVTEAKPAVEFLLVAPMLANPETFFDRLQPEYGKVLLSLERVGAAAVDMGQMHSAMLKHKRYVDLTGNNINHPNDFLSRCYAMSILSTLIDFMSHDRPRSFLHK